MTRHVRIYQPAKTAMQSGRGSSKRWVLEYETETPRRPEPLMGWIASGDTLNQVQIRFQSAEQAVAFAEAHGWTYAVQTPKTRHIPPKNYGDNFR